MSAQFGNVWNFRRREVFEFLLGAGGALARKMESNEGVRERAMRKLFMVAAAPSVATLRATPGNRVKKLKGVERGRYSLRVNEQWRVTFALRDGSDYYFDVDLESH